MATGLTKGQDTTNGMRVYQGFRDQREALAEEGDAHNNRKRQEGTLGEPLGAGPVCTDEATLGSDPRTRISMGASSPHYDQSMGNWGPQTKVPSVLRPPSSPAAQPVGLRLLDLTHSRKAISLLTEAHEARLPPLTASCRNGDRRLHGNGPGDTTKAAGLRQSHQELGTPQGLDVPGP